MRSVIGQVAPPRDIVGDLYNNIPLGSDYAFQGTSFVVTNALLLVLPPPPLSYTTSVNPLDLSVLANNAPPVVPLNREDCQAVFVLCKGCNMLPIHLLHQNHGFSRWTRLFLNYN